MGKRSELRAGDVLVGGAGDDRPGRREGVLRGAVRLGDQGHAHWRRRRGLLDGVHRRRSGRGDLRADSSEQRDAGIPPYWFNYVTVASADDAAEAVKAAGGSVHMEPFDVLTAGPDGRCRGPDRRGCSGSGSRATASAPTLVNDPGHADLERAVDQRRRRGDRVLRAAVRLGDRGDGHRRLAPVLGRSTTRAASDGQNGGIRELAPEQEDAGVPPHWLPYFAVESTDDAVAKATSAGATAMFGPLDVPAGRIAVIADPQGAAFAVFEGALDD